MFTKTGGTQYQYVADTFLFNLLFLRSGKIYFGCPSCIISVNYLNLKYIFIILYNQ